MTSPVQLQLGRHHRGDPETSRRAALANYPRSGSQKRLVLDELLRAGPTGATYTEIQARTGIDSTQQRLSDLKAGGWVEPNGMERLTPRGVAAEAYVLTDQARAWIGPTPTV